MSQVYHNNAKTNQHIRFQIQQSSESNKELQSQYHVSIKTIKVTIQQIYKSYDCSLSKMDYFFIFHIIMEA
jgi:hypothetical protein